MELAKSETGFRELENLRKQVGALIKSHRMVSEQQCRQNLSFSCIFLENFAKTLESTKKPKFGCQNAGGYQETKKTKFWSLELPNYPVLKNFVFFGFFGTQCSKTFFLFFCTLLRCGTKTVVFLVPLKVLGEFWSKTCQSPGGSQKKQQNAGGYQKTNKKQSFGVLSCQTTQCSKTLFFFVFVGTLQRFGTQTLVFLVPSRVLARFCSKMLPKHREVPKAPIRPWVLKICDSVILRICEPASR